jgi:hypothetical protein
MLVLSKERVPSGTGSGVSASHLPTVLECLALQCGDSLSKAVETEPYELAPLQPAIGQSQAYAYRGCANGDRQGLA